MIKGRAKLADFQFIIDRVRECVNSWKSKLLNKAKRLCLTRSIISAIPSYTMQTLWLPTTICGALDQMNRSLLWSNNVGNHY
uniref:Ribonuclease H protein At1g65750 n=1 Tax=Cajanus cajan TaxID=3821 RepID=A0A151UBA3_CAJCA|nr:Putative ribonuclease H protein At1g65750 [Cajanus cajan]